MKKLVGLFSIMSILCSVIFSNSAYCRSTEEEKIIKTNAGIVKIFLPSNWEKKGEDKTGALWMRSKPYGLFAVVISSLKYVTSACDTEAYQRQFLAKVKESLGGNEAEFEEGASYFNVPTLIYTREVKASGKNKTRKIRDLHFLKDCRYYNITFGCDKGYFNKQWKDMEARIRKISFSG